MSRRSLQLIAAAVALLWSFATAAARPHPGLFASAVVKVGPDGVVTVTIRHDALAFALDAVPAAVRDEPMLALLDGPDTTLDAAFAKARARFLEQFSIEVDGKTSSFELLASPTAAEVREWERSQSVRALPVRLDFAARAQAPAGRHTLAVLFPLAMGEVITTFDRPGLEPIAVPVGAAELSPEVEVIVAGPQAHPPHPTAAPTPAATPNPTDSTAASTPGVTFRYIALGFTHIIPHGLDHVLFVLGLFLLSPRLKPLLWQVTAFTVAHTLTLALTVLEVLPGSPSIVEPLIAASIAFVALENLATSRLHPWRPLLVFAFGLLHGMGFAGVLKDAGLPGGQLANALVSFNVGVELGQLSVIAGALLLVGWFRARPWYRRRITIPASALIAAVALFWTVQRLAG